MPVWRDLAVKDLAEALYRDERDIRSLARKAKQGSDRVEWPVLKDRKTGKPITDKDGLAYAVVASPLLGVASRPAVEVKTPGPSAGCSRRNAARWHSDFCSLAARLVWATRPSKQSRPRPASPRGTSAGVGWRQARRADASDCGRWPWARPGDALAA